MAKRGHTRRLHETGNVGVPPQKTDRTGEPEIRDEPYASCDSTCI